MVECSQRSKTLLCKMKAVHASQKLYNKYPLKQANSIQIVLCRENEKGTDHWKKEHVCCLY